MSARRAGGSLRGPGDNGGREGRWDEVFMEENDKILS